MNAQREPKTSPLEALLICWSESQLQGEEPSGTLHPLERARQFAPGKRVRQPISRARQALNLMFGGPAWGRDHVKGRETRAAVHHSPPLISDAARVETAYQELRAKHPELADCLYLRYCASGGVSDKARRLGLTVGKFREGVASARNWMGWRLGA